MEKYSSIVSVVWTIFACTVFLNDCSGSIGPEKRLLKDLMENYDPDEWPSKNTSDTINLEFALSFRQLQNLDERLQVMTSLVWLTLKWKDAFLQWNSSDYEGHSIIRLDPSRIWTPDLTLYNTARKNGDDLHSFKSKVTVTSNGSVIWMTPAILKSVCAIDVSKFPFDTQQCTMNIGSWAYDGLALDVNILDRGLSAPETDSFQKNSVWELESAFAKKDMILYSCCPASFAVFTFTFRFRRKPSYYCYAIVFPCIILSLVISISFLFPADSGERVTLVISVLLVFFVFMLLVNQITPITSESIPIITKYFTANVSLTFLALLATACILRMNHPNPGRPVPRYLVNICNYLAFVFRVKKITKESLQPNLGEICLTDATHSFNLCDFRKRLTEEKILKEVQKLSKRLEEQDSVSKMKDDWQLTMQIFDRMFFCLFSLAFFVCFVVFISHH